MTRTQNPTTEPSNQQHADNAAHHYVQALHASLDHFYQEAVQAAHDALHTEALAEDTALHAARTENQSSSTIQPPHHDWRITDACYATNHQHPTRAYWLDEPILSGMFTAMTHHEIHDQYGQQEIIVVTGDYADMFDLH